MKTPRTVFNPRNPPRQRRPIYMDIPDCEKNCNAVSRPAPQRFIHDFEHSSIRRRNYRGCVLGNDSHGVTEEIQNERTKCQKAPAAICNPRMCHPRTSAKNPITIGAEANLYPSLTTYTHLGKPRPSGFRAASFYVNWREDYSAFQNPLVALKKPCRPAMTRR